MMTIMSSTATLSPRQILTDIRRSPDFVERRAPGELGHAFSAAAQALAELETSPSGLRTVEGHAFALVSQVNGFAESVDALKRPGLTRLGEDFHTRRLIAFNHELRDMVDTYQDLAPDQLRELLLNAYNATHSPDQLSDTARRTELKQLSEELDSLMFGMWSEINGEMVIAAAGYETDSEVSANDERRGIDSRVLMRPVLEDRGWMPVDLKGTAVAARERNAQHPDACAVWSQLTRDEYVRCGSFRISPQVAQSKAADMRADLESLYSWYTR